MTVAQMIVAVRNKLLETTATFWADSELIDHINHGRRDLYRAIVNEREDHFFKTTAANVVTMTPSAKTLSGVPADVAKVIGILPTTPNSFPTLNFFPRRYNDPDMLAARATDPLDPSVAGPIYYTLTGAGGPIGAPVIYVAPAVTSTVSLELTYVPSLIDLGVNDPNDIPGESDDALIAYTIAHALAKERGDRKPDADWLAKYATEKEGVLVFLDPRQEDEPEIAEGVHESFIM